MMEVLLPTLASGLAALVAACGGVLWLRSHTADLQSAGMLLDEHYAATQRLVSNPQTPDSIVDFAVFLASQAAQPKLARGFAAHLLRGKLGSQKSTMTEKRRQFERDLHQLDAGQQQVFGNMVALGMLASAAADPVFSGVYRRALTMFFSKSGEASDRSVSVERANTAALDVSAFCPA